MSNYIGPAPEFGQLAKQILTPDSSTVTFNLDYHVPNSQSLIVNYGGVIQEPGVAYNTGGSSVTFTFVPQADILLYVVFLGKILEIPTPAANTVTESSLQSEIATPILLNTKVASSSASIDFDAGLDWTTYKSYLFKGFDIIPGTTSTYMLARVSNDNGTSYRSTSGDYLWSVGWNRNNAAGAGQTHETLISTAFGISTNDILLSTTAGSNMSFEFLIKKPATTTMKKICKWDAQVYNASIPAMINISGDGVMDTNNLAIDGIRFLMSSGNIASGTFEMYGLR